MDELDEAKRRTIAAYDAAADTYDDPANTFWDRFGRRTIERLGLARGDAVLDVCCGSGASAIPAAEAVGAEGSILGIDLAERLLDVARSKARARGLDHLVFRVGDLLDLADSTKRYDAVVCVFGIFFVPDMAAALRALWTAVKPGGSLAVTTWGPRFFEPGSEAFWDAVRDVAPELHKAFNPWDRVDDPPSLRHLFEQAGIANATVIAEAGSHPVASPAAWWAAVLGSGYRGTVDRLDAAARDRVRAANEAFIREAGIGSVEANVVYAVAKKPSSERPMPR